MSKTRCATEARLRPGPPLYRIRAPRIHTVIAATLEEFALPVAGGIRRSAVDM